MKQRYTNNDILYVVAEHMAYSESVQFTTLQ